MTDGADAPRPPPPEAARDRGGLGRWLLGGLLIIDLVLLLSALSLANVTTEGPAQRSLRQSVAILIEVDTYLDTHFDAIREEAVAQQGAEGSDVTLPDLPFDLSFTAEELLTAYAERDTFRAELLRRSAERVYDEGMAVFQGEEQTDIAFFSLQGAVQRGMNVLRPGPHAVFVALTVVFAVLAAILSLGLMLGSRAQRRLLPLGVSISLAALPVLVTAIALRFVLRQAADSLDDYLAQELLALGQELTWAPIRNGMIVSVGGGVFVALGAGFRLWGDRA